MDSNCRGYYDTMKDAAGTEIHRDLCVPRATTNLGCLCQAHWTTAGEAFKGTCANPNNRIGGDWCYVVPGKDQCSSTLPWIRW